VLAARIIKEQKSTMNIEKLQYSALDERYDINIFTANPKVCKSYVTQKSPQIGF